MTQGERVMFFYFAKGTAEWKGYEVNTLPRFTVVEMSERRCRNRLCTAACRFYQKSQRADAQLRQQADAKQVTER